MEINSDFKDLLRLFVDEKVRFLVVGGYAVIKHTEPYYTKDLDIWIDAALDNASRAIRALARFGAPVENVTVEDLASPDLIYQLGVEPVRIDVMAEIPGLKFSEAWGRRETADFGGLSVPILSFADILTAKRTANRPKDRLQIKQLLAAKKRLTKPSC